ncbi:MAG: phytoene desaturase, partial [Bacteroidetes bacterium]|nr:phytoene desaturase [Bacteroidota bacterium]
AEFEEVEPDFEKKIISFLGQAGKLFHDTENLVFRRAFNNKCQYLLSLSRIPSKYGRKFFRGIWSELGKHFESSEAKELLSLVSFFLGSSPYNKSAVFTILSYIELVHDGFFNVQDGMYKVVEGLLREVEKAGVEITYNSEITGYIGSGRKIYSLIDHTGEAYNADVYVVNSNAPYFKNKIFNRKKYKPSKLNDMPWNLAPLTIYLGLDQKVDELNLHHYFLDKNFEEYTRGILNNSADLFQPNYYVNTPSKVNPLCAPKGCENLFIFCPVPNKIHKSDWSDRETIVDNIIANLSSRIGVNLESMILEKIVLGPMQWEQQFNLYQSNSLNQSKNLNHFGGYRPSNKDEKFNNVFYVGASTIPGAGLPMSVISSKLVTDRIIKKFGSFN